MAIHIKVPPEAKPERISRLVTRIDSGDVKVPVFQRRYVWKTDKVLALLDSIYRGYPIGSLLFWLTQDKLATERDLGDFNLPATPEKYPRNYVLDGQQRLATIYGVLSWKGNPADDHVFNVSFDLEGDGKFIRSVTPAAPTHIPMNLLFDTTRFRGFQIALLQRPDADALIKRTETLSETFREYSVPVVTVTEPSVEDVSKIFERINNSATKLTVVDLMVAATWCEQFDLRAEIQGVMSGLSKKDFGKVYPVGILQVLSAMSADGASRRAITALRNQTPDQLKKAMKRVREALKRAVDFLVNEVHVKSSDFLPYEKQLVVLGFAFAQRRKPSPHDVGVLRQWFWRTAYSERYRRGGEGLFDEDLAAVIEAFTDGSVLDRFSDEAISDAVFRTEFRKGSALTHAFVATLAMQGPRNLLDGSSIDTARSLSSFNRKEFHHIFPQAFLRGMGVTKARSNVLANICMLNSGQNKGVSDERPSVYVARLRTSHGAKFQSVLDSNLIPKDAVPALLADNFDEFVRIRSAYLAKRVMSLL